MEEVEREGRERGALNFEAAHIAARAGEEGRAWRYWDHVDRVAQRLPQGFYQPQTSFSRVIMVAHAVALAVELQKPGEAVRQADGPWSLAEELTARLTASHLT